MIKSPSGLKKTAFLLISMLFITATTVHAASSADKVDFMHDLLDALELIPDAKLFTQEPNWDDMTCSQAINTLLGDITDIGSIFYILLNGWYFGEWGDYSSCLKDATDGQYVLATIHGNYTGGAYFTRGNQGKFSPYSARIGLCFPKQCSADDL